MKTNFVLTALAGLTLLFASCSKSDDAIDSILAGSDEIKSTEMSALLGDSCDFTATLSEDEIAGLLTMREEEKLAHDVYVTFFDTYGEAIFQNIANSESMHMEAILNLITGFGLEDPVLEGTGNFSNEVFSGLYTQLVGQGEDLVAALKVGAYIEELDINDLVTIMGEIENTDLLRVYGNLERGSGSHLRAFVKVLNSLGYEYTPKILSGDDFDTIMSGSNGRNGQGSGYGTNNGNGQGNGNNYAGSNGTGVCDSTQTGSNGNQYGNRNGK